MIRLKSMFLAIALVFITAPAWSITVDVIDELGVNNCNNCELIGIDPDDNGRLIIYVNSGSTTVDPTPVNGVCGSANGGTFLSKPTSNLCSSGTAGTVSGSGPWSWTCYGSNGGSSSTCQANLQSGGDTADPSCKLLPAAGVRFVSIPAYGSHCYYITIPDSVAYAGIYATMGSMDWKTNQDLLIKKGSKPTKTDYDATYAPGAKGSGPTYWYLYTSESNETLQPNKVGPGTYYFYVYNRGAINTGAQMTGLYELKATWYETTAPTTTSPSR